jgi:amino acid adenylation domain-containing protein
VDFDGTLVKALQNPRRSVLDEATRQAMRERSVVSTESSLANAKVETANEGAEDLSALEGKIRDAMSKFTTVPKDKIRRDMSIYRLGLDSISAVQLAAVLRKLGFNVLGSDVIQNPSIAKLAAFLESKTEAARPESQRPNFDFEAFEKKWKEKVYGRIGLTSEQVEAVRPCTHVQAGMLALTVSGSGHEYINSFEMVLRQDVSLMRIRDAWAHAHARFQMLRTGFLEVGERDCPFVMVTYHAESFELPWKVVGDEEDDVDAVQAVAKCLERMPWRLDVLERGGETRIRFTAHHAIYDAMSLQTILAAVAEYYVNGPSASEAESDGGANNALLDAILTASKAKEEAKKAFWEAESKLSVCRFPELTPLNETSARTLARERMSAITLDRFQALCRERDVSAQAAGQAAWCKLLALYTGEDSATFEVTLSGRSVLNNSESIAFPSIVTLPVSCQLAGSNGDLLAQTMRLNAKLHEHQFTPLTSILKWAQCPQGKKLSDTLFAYQTTDLASSVDLWTVAEEESSAEYAVSFELQVTKSHELQLRLTFKENVVPIEQAELILEQYDAILLDLLESPDMPCDKVNTSTKLLSITPPEKLELPAPVQLLHQFVEMQARQQPNKIALEFTSSFEPPATETWPYAQLDRKANQFGNFILSDAALKGKTLIAICFDKCPEASFAIIGILKAGCAFVALDPNAPPDRLKFIVQDAGAKLVLSAGKPAEMLDRAFEHNSDVRIVNVGQQNLFEGVTGDSCAPRWEIKPDDIAYCLYTSGTTGMPKGCEITHENVVQAMLAFQHLFKGHWTEESKWLQFASFHFDVSVLEQFWSWSVGICVASAPRDLIFEDIPEAIRRMSITHIDLTPSLARLLSPEEVPSLHKGVFITGGEALRQEILDQWGSIGCIYNGYGPTEATIGVTMFPRVPANGKPANIGPQFLNVGSYVFKLGTTEPVMRGAVGELCVSGKLVGKGYLNRPELTAERFPYVEEFGERVYRTGDLVRQLHDGSFLFLGRKDDQVKLRGQRLELSEINEVARKHVAGLKDVVTLVLQHREQEKEQLVLFYVPEAQIDPGTAAGTEGKEPATESESTQQLLARIRIACKTHLSAYMVPTYFISLPRLPLSANNKADHKALAAHFDSMSATDLHSLNATQLAAQGVQLTPREMDLLRKLAMFLDMQESEIDQNKSLLEYGVDSITVVALARALKDGGFQNVTVASILKSESPSFRPIVWSWL